MSDQKIIVTGTAGVSVKECLRKLDYDFISIDDYILDKYGINMEKFILLPQNVQFNYWSESFLELKDKEFNNKDILTFHASYSHQAKRENFPVMNFNAISDSLKGNVKMIVVFIDDIYRVYKRLLLPGKMFGKLLRRKEKFDELDRKTEKKIELDAIYESIENIINLLYWREMEITISWSLAQFLKTNFLIIPTNHPKFMIKRIFEQPLNELNIYYLSHPISTIRKKSKSIMSGFLGQLKTAYNEFLLKDKNNILFIPTCIDELRVKKDKNDLYVPELDSRWELPYDEKKLSPELEDKIEDLAPLNPYNYQVRERDKPSISSLINLLCNLIHHRQIYSRDYGLVEQSKNGVIAIRPYLNGELSSGMKGEIEHNINLINQQDHRKCFIFSCQYDWNQYCISKLLGNYYKLDSKDFNSKKKKLYSDGYNVLDRTPEQIKEDLENKFLKKNYDYTKIYKVDDWQAAEFGKNDIAKEKLAKHITEDLKRDEIEDIINEAKGKYPGIKDKIQYIKDIDIDTFFSDVSEMLKKIE